MHPDQFNISNEDFEKAMHEIDADLRAESPIFRGREVRGWAMFCQRFGLDEVRMDHPLSQRIYAWFHAMYGDRLNIDFDLGKTVVHLNGDLYPLRCVRSFGTVIVICSPSMLGMNLGPKLRTDGTRPILNILDFVLGLTPAMARRLSFDHCKVILQSYCEAFLTFLGLESAFGQRYIKEAIDDCQMSVESLFLRTPNYGLSRYSSLQAVEKTLKSFILSKGKAPAFTHRLISLTNEAYTLGLPELDKNRIADVQCAASVRYDANGSTKDEAVIAHHSAFDIIREVVLHLPKKPGFQAVTDAKFQIDNSSEKTPAAGLVNLLRDVGQTTIAPPKTRA
jgi:HEPN domain-containing protein